MVPHPYQPKISVAMLAHDSSTFSQVAHFLSCQTDSQLFHLSILQRNKWRKGDMNFSIETKFREGKKKCFSRLHRFTSDTDLVCQV